MQQYIDGDIDFENLFQLGQRYLDTIDIHGKEKILCRQAPSKLSLLQFY